MISNSNSKFENRLKYLRDKYRHESESIQTNNNVEPDQSEKINPEDDLTFLKEAVIDQIDLSVIKQKLNNTRKLRMEKMKDDKFDFRVSLPFMLSHPKLVFFKNLFYHKLFSFEFIQLLIVFFSTDTCGFCFSKSECSYKCFD